MGILDVYVVVTAETSNILDSVFTKSPVIHTDELATCNK